MAGSRSRVLVAVAAVALVLATCGDSGSGTATGSGDDGNANADAHRAMLTSLATTVLRPAIDDFDAATATLVETTAAWAASKDDADRTAAQDAWSSAMAIWQQLEVMQVGPAGPQPTAAGGGVPGGQNLRDEIYSWPIDNPCKVDQELLDSTYEDEAALAAETPNAYGLDAIEYLLFRADDGNACPDNLTINTSGDWAALTADELLTRRSGYAAVAATILRGHAQTLATAWAADGGDFATQLGTAGDGSDVYGSAHEALNAVSDALFYLDTDAKDMKLATPAGDGDCDATTCSEELESRWANRSKEHVLANLQGFRAVLTGGDATGFDDLLVDMGASELATTMIADVDAAIAAVEAFEGTFAAALPDNPQAILALYDVVKAVTDNLKSQFLSVLDLELPMRAAGDND